jgi:integrase
VLPYIGDLLLQQIHDGTVAPFVEARLADGKAAGTINRSLAVVHRILTLAARAWRDEHGLTWLESAPLLTLQRGPKRKGHILSVEEQHRFLARLPKHLSEMALFGLHTGCRQGEIVGLRWEWMMERDGLRYVALPGHVTKNGEGRPIVLNRVATRIVDACRGRHSTHVFTYQPRGKRARHPVERLRNSAWRRARAAVGLPGLQVHDLRRTFATRLRDAGVPKWTVSACLGHKDGGVTELYALPTLRELQAAVETLEVTQHRRFPRTSSVISSSVQDGAGAETYGRN